LSKGCLVYGRTTCGDALENELQEMKKEENIRGREQQNFKEV